MRLGTMILVATTLLPACEVNLNRDGLTVRDVRTFKVTGQAELVLDTFDGSIELHSWDKNEIEVEIEKRAMEQALLDEIAVEAQQQGGKVTVKVTGPQRMEQRGIGVSVSPTARLRVVVPRNTNVSAISGDGSIRVEAIDGRLLLNTTDGSVTGVRLGGDIQIRSGDGSIRLEHAIGKIDLETTDGSITLEAKPTTLRARTGDGSIRATIEADSVMSENWELTTSDGSVSVTLPGQFSAELDAETSDGVVHASHPLLDGGPPAADAGNSTTVRRERRTLKSKVGEGGKTLRIRTGDGTIRIER